MEIKYPNLIKVHHSRRGYPMRDIVMIVIIAILSLLLCMSARAETVNNPYQIIPISDEDFVELRWVLALEAQGEGYTGEVACCEAIFNRCLSQKNNWGGNLHGVLSKKKQFSSYKYIGSSKAWAVPGEMEDDVISEVLRRGLTVLPSYDYVYFDSRGGVNGSKHIKIGRHTFGKE